MEIDWLRDAVASVPAWSWILQALGLVTAYAGAELNARRRIEGFHIWIASNVALAILHAASHLWLLLALDMLFLRVNFIGIRRWRRDLAALGGAHLDGGVRTSPVGERTPSGPRPAGARLGSRSKLPGAESIG